MPHLTCSLLFLGWNSLQEVAIHIGLISHVHLKGRTGNGGHGTARSGEREQTVFGQWSGESSGLSGRLHDSRRRSIAGTAP